MNEPWVGAQKQLETTLGNLRTHYLDLWMVHDVRTPKDLEQIFGPQGAIKAFETARKNEQVRFTGISGHRNPAILSRALDLFPFDVVLMPVNPAEPFYWSFFEDALPKASKKGLGILGMKTLSRGVATKIFSMESVDDVSPIRPLATHFHSGCGLRYPRTIRDQCPDRAILRAHGSQGPACPPQQGKTLRPGIDVLQTVNGFSPPSLRRCEKIPKSRERTGGVGKIAGRLPNRTLC